MTDLDGVVKLGPSGAQLTHAMGSVTPIVHTTKSDIDLIDTVKADNYSIGIFLAFPLIIFLINFVHRLIMKKVNPRARTERGGVVMNKLIRILLNQPNYAPDDFTMRLLIALSLFGTLFFLTVYWNIFGSDLTVSETAQDIDYVSQLEQSNRYII